MKMGKKMAISIHIRDSGRSNKVKKEDAKEIGIWKWMNDEEYEREKDEIIVHLEVFMELLQRNKEDQRCGFVMRGKMKWHRLQKNKEKVMKAQWEDEVLKENEYRDKVLMAETLSEAKRSQDLESDILCMLVG